MIQSAWSPDNKIRDDFINLSQGLEKVILTDIGRYWGYWSCPLITIDEIQLPWFRAFCEISYFDTIHISCVHFNKQKRLWFVITIYQRMNTFTSCSIFKQSEINLYFFFSHFYQILMLIILVAMWNFSINSVSGEF